MIVPTSRRWPRIVAESLASVAEPVTTLGRRPVPATVAEVVAAAAAAATPGRSAARPPAFLKVHQVDPWRRVLHALSRYGGALLAEPTGSGKSWIALAIASLESRPATIIAPALLLTQWSAIARQAGVTISCWSQERISRGALPPTASGLVIIDEAHRLRDPAINRVRTLAPWLVGQRVLLLTATPIVNQLRDLITLLRLAVPENALALDGVMTLAGLEACATPPAALRRLVIRSLAPLVHASRDLHSLRISVAEEARAAKALLAIGSLVLSRDTAIRRLLRSVLLDAAASSDAALHRALQRYRALLLQARDARGISRASVRRFAGEALDQMVFWDLVGGERDSELVLDDIPLIEHALLLPSADEPWIAEVLRLLPADGVAVCFTRHRATAQLLRRALGDGVAWVTGSEAGIGPHRLPRATVLEAFGPARCSWTARRQLPRILIATDVAAEGLDLQAAGTIAHIDLPWTAMRLEQREGRLLRIGQLQPRVGVIVRRPPPAIEAKLLAQQRIRRKGRLSDRWLEAMCHADSPTRPTDTAPQVAVIDDGGRGALLLVVATTRGLREGLRIVTMDDGGNWESNAEMSAALWHRAQLRSDHAAAELPADAHARLAAGLQRLLGNTDPHGPGSAGLIARIQRMARSAAARRDAAAMSALDRLLRFAIAPPTLGGRILLDGLVEARDVELLRAQVVDIPRPEPVAVRLIAALLFRSPTSPLRCPDA